jgi:thioredoxin-related protein
MKILILCFFSFFYLSEPKWGSDLGSAQQEAKDKHKLILLYFSGSDWCGPCIKLKKDVLESDAFLGFANTHLALVRADFPRMKKNQLDKVQIAKNEKLAEMYNKKGKFPFTVLLDATGKVLHEWDGYPKSLDSTSLKKEIEAFL